MFFYKAVSKATFTWKEDDPGHPRRVRLVYLQNMERG